MQLICKCGLYASVYGNYGSKEVVSDMLVFIADRWPTCLSDLMDNGREEIGRMVKWLFPILERAGCDISAIQDQWVSEDSNHWPVLQDRYDSLCETFLTKQLYKADYRNVLTPGGRTWLYPSKITSKISRALTKSLKSSFSLVTNKPRNVSAIFRRQRQIEGQPWRGWM